MMQPKYQFHYQKINYSYRPTLLVLGGVIGFLILLIGWTDFVMDLPWYVFVAVIVVWVLAFRYNLKKAGELQSEEVLFTLEGMQSRLFDDFMYKDVKSFHISLTRAKFFPQNSLPSLRIKLQDGKQIKYDLALKHFNTEAKTFIIFIDQFLVEMKTILPGSYEQAQLQLKKYIELQKDPSKNIRRILWWTTAMIIIGVLVVWYIENNQSLF